MDISVVFFYFPPACRENGFPDLALSVFNEFDLGGGLEVPLSISWTNILQYGLLVWKEKCRS